MSGHEEHLHYSTAGITKLIFVFTFFSDKTREGKPQTQTKRQRLATNLLSKL